MPLTPKGQIDRTGSVSFGDASISVWEDSIPGTNVPDAIKKREAWELNFKRQVFSRVVQTLNRIGWSVKPWEDTQKFPSIAEGYRTCTKAGLAGELNISGRTIEFKMWQTVLPSQNPSGPRYDFNREDRMPYVVRLEMERTRRRIRDYLCNVFSGYTVCTRRPSRRVPGETAIESISRNWAESNRSSPDQWEAYTRKRTEEDVYNGISRDGVRIQHGQTVYVNDSKGRWLVGEAYIDGGMWNVVTGPLTYERKGSSEITTTRPQNLRIRSNERARRGRLESELNAAVKAMNFKRAELLKNILFPSNETLYLIKTKGDGRSKGAYFAPNYCGYRNSQVDAGKYTRSELKAYFGDKLETDELVAVPVA